MDGNSSILQATTLCEHQAHPVRFEFELMRHHGTTGDLLLIAKGTTGDVCGMRTATQALEHPR